MITARSEAGEAPSAVAGTYQAFGFCIRSALPLPDLPPAPPGAQPDVEIVLRDELTGTSATPPAEPQTTISDGACVVTAPPGRFRIEDGRRIEIEPAAGAAPEEIRLYLLGSALGALCHQRGLLVLHASAVSHADGALAFAGPSGAGKSTLAAGFGARGRTVLCDDVCAVSIGAAACAVLPGLARLKLWPDSLALLGRNADGLEPVAPGIGKYSLTPSKSPAVGRSATPLRALFILRPSEATHPRLVRLGGPEAVAAILGAVYRPAVAAQMGHQERLFAQAVRLARDVPVFEAAFTPQGAAPFALADAIGALLGAQVPANVPAVDKSPHRGKTDGSAG